MQFFGQFARLDEPQKGAQLGSTPSQRGKLSSDLSGSWSFRDIEHRVRLDGRPTRWAMRNLWGYNAQ